ncbi:MAG: helix-turn-helix domain-containing protein [Eubacterium sp.]|nr:helix-turn-helix domain-containing protein [Eubacterium sp.]
MAMDKKTTELGNLIRRCRGTRSLRQYAEDSGVSSSSIHLVETGQYTPSLKILKKLVSESAKPQNGIELDDVLSAAGILPVDFAGESTELGEYHVEGVRYDKQRMNNRMESYHKYLSPKEATEIVETAKKTIISKLMNSGRYFAVIPVPRNKNRRGLFTWLLEVDYNFKFSWKMTFVIGGALFYGGGISLALLDLLKKDTITNINSKNYKYSLVTDDIKIFTELTRFKDLLLFRGDLSVILFSLEKEDIIDEVFLSNYEEGNHKNELYYKDLIGKE